MSPDIKMNGIKPQNGFPSYVQGLEEDPICIVGMACRLPGGIRCPSDLWDFLVEKKSASGKINPERFNKKGFYAPSESRAGVMNVDGAYLIEEDVRSFDNGFFGINNLEATYMDPQQRKLLEVTFECFESAGLSMDKVSGSNTGVYVANFTHDYFLMSMRDPDSLHRYHGTGSGATLLANRISHAFNLHGPSFTLDTACSSSIHCLHTAVSALRNGECDGAIVAASNLILTPEPFVAAMKTGVLSSSSICQTFGAGADGYGRAEGVNAVYLKTLSAALRDGDDISAVIRGTAINSNGRTPGITLPSAEFQEAVIRKAYSAAKLDFSGTDYVECHGTGTMVGDPIEVEALGRCFSGQHRNTPVFIGSVKSNLGHSEATSGLTSLIKVALAFQRGFIPPMREPATMNPKIPFEQLGMKIVADPEPWPSKLIQRASLNSFGYGGANAHAVVESFESFISSQGPILPKHGIYSVANEPLLVTSSHEALVLPFSAMSPASLGQRGEQVGQIARRCDESTLRKLSFTLAFRRPHLNIKACLLAQLSHDSGDVHVEFVEAPAASQQNLLPLAFIFTGQGAQYAGMAKELMQRSSVFLASIREQDATLRALPRVHAPNWTLEKTIMDSSDISQIHDAARSQPACTAVQIALVQVMASWGISPSAVIGHSSGEIAAAYAAGLLSLSEAILVSYLRGLAVNSVRTEAGMMATGLSVDDAHSLISDMNLHGELQVACVNAPESVTVSGSIPGLDKMSSVLKDQGRFCRRLETGGRAYHSHIMKEAGLLYKDLLQRYVNIPNSAKGTHVAMYSTVGCAAELAPVINGTAVGPDYWQGNLENMVLFTRALDTLNSVGTFHFIEVGPHSALRGPIHQTLASPSLLYSPTLVRGVDSDLSIKKLAATLYTHGHQISWDKVNNLRPMDRTAVHDMPPYPWDYSGGLLWSESRFATDMRNRSHPRHELLGSQELCGSDVDWKWRNVIHLDEIPWIQDHKVEEQIIFPAAGYMAVAIEAISQVFALKASPGHTSPSFQFQNVSFSAALVLSDETKQANTELHTTFSRRRLSSKTASSIFYDFSVSSWKAGKAVVHCGGGIRILDVTSTFEGSVLVKDDIGYRDWPMEPWYEKAAHEGLCFGPALQSITTLRADNARIRSESICVTHMTPPDTEYANTKYAIHPIVIDACLQAAILSAAAGDINTFAPYLPVFIENCRISPVAGTQPDAEEAFIHVRSNKTGVSSLRADSSLRDSLGATHIDMQGVRLSRYSGKLSTRTSLDGDLSDRQPVMRVVWNPDVVQIDATVQESFSKYIEDSASLSQARMSKDETIQDLPKLITTVGTVLDLLGHKNPRLRVLNLTNTNDDLDLDYLWCNILDRETSFSRCRDWTSRSLTAEGRLDGSETNDEDEDDFDVVICVGPESDNDWQHNTDRILSHAGTRGFIITRTTEMSRARLEAAGFDTLMAHHDITLATRPLRGHMTVAGRNAIILTPSQPSHAASNLATALNKRLLKSNAEAVNILAIDELDSATIDSDTVCLSLLEVEQELLASLSTQAMDSLRKITNSVRDLIWMTGADMLSDSPNADLTLAPGLARSLMMEQPALRFVILDIGRPDSFQKDMDLTCKNIERLLIAPRDVDDKEYIQYNGLLHVSRLSPDFAVNSLFRRRLRIEDSLETLSLAEARPVKVDIGRPGSADTIFFQQIHEPTAELPPGFIDVEVKAVSLNAKDVYAIHGLTETRKGTIALEFTGRVVNVAADVEHLAPGDAVLVCVPNDFATTQRVPAWQAHKLQPGEDFREMSTLLVTNVAALYALRDRSNLRRGESVLIHSGAGAFGLAAITMAQRIGATVYTTVGSSSRREYLVNNLGVKPDHIFSSRDESFVDGIMQKTNGRGVSVVINSLVGDLMHASWRCVAEFGRFIEVGKRELLDAGKLDMHMFTRSVSFTAFDITEMLYHEDEYYRGLYNSLSKEVVAMFRSGDIRLVPITTFDAADIAHAYRYFSSQDRIGKVVISFENDQSVIPVAPPKYRATFAGDKSYLLVGCLGGLGRSITNWMRTRGASNFVFLGRSGSDNPQAADLVHSLERSGSCVTVVRGDVANPSDVANAVKAAQSLGRVGGVVHAAMGLHEDLFNRMSNKGWQTSVRPKWAGAWNLHNALLEEDLDFFLLTSSMTGTVGVATESNYCAANAFLDAFAYWRRAQGKRATSIGLGMISEVGYLHENPKIESLLLRRGIKPLNEDEFLQVVDLAITGAGKGSDSKTSAASLMLTGMETCGVRDLLSQGYEVTHTVMDDQRSAILSAALEASQRDHRSANSDTNWDPSTAQWLKGIHQDAAIVLKAESNANCLNDAIEGVIGRKFSNLLLIPPEKVDYKRFFADFGVDSMIASEFRTWFWNVFKVDVPFLDLLGSESNLSTVAAQVEASLVARMESE